MKILDLMIQGTDFGYGKHGEDYGFMFAVLFTSIVVIVTIINKIRRLK